MNAARPDPLWTIDATLVAKGFKFERPPLVYRGPMAVHGNIIQVEIEVPDVSFVRMPKVRMLEGASLPVERLAHVLDERGVCYFGQGGLPLDLYDPGGSVLRVLIEAEAALGTSFAGGAKTEFEAELAAYWRGNSYYVAIPRPAISSIVSAEMLPVRESNNSGIVVIPAGAWKAVAAKWRLPAVVLTFTEDLQHDTSFPPRSLGAALKYVQAQVAPPAGWRKAILDAAGSGQEIFLSAPNAIIGWVAELPKGLLAMRGKGFRPHFFAKTLEERVNTVPLERKVGSETDLRHCVERNLLGRPNLLGKEIVLIGCGTIGGYLARLLAQSGAGCEGTIDLYDTDVLSPGNIGRHALGFPDLGRPKTEAVADHLRSFHPDVTVTAHKTDAVRAWETISRADLIIDATGEPNVATALNDLYNGLEGEGGPTLLHVWVFGNGVAAQSFLNLKDSGACYRCLKTSFDGQWRHDPRKDTTAAFEQAAARCGEAGYAPFSVDAPMTAAALALRAALDWAGGAPGQRLRTTVIDQVAGRERMPWASPQRLEDCPACHG